MCIPELTLCLTLSDITKNRNRRKAWRAEGLTDEEALQKSEMLAERDTTDLENPYFIYTF